MTFDHSLIFKDNSTVDVDAETFEHFGWAGLISASAGNVGVLAPHITPAQVEVVAVELAQKRVAVKRARAVRLIALAEAVRDSDLPADVKADLADILVKASP